jgi:hypothetical protein
MNKKLIVLMIRDHKFVSLEPSSSAFKGLQFNKSLVDCTLVWTLHSDGCKKSKLASLERYCIWDALF